VNAYGFMSGFKLHSWRMLRDFSPDDV
jgi:hypothetical protein